MGTKSTTKTKVTPFDAPGVAAARSAQDSGYAKATAFQDQAMPGVTGAINNLSRMIANPPAYQTDARAQLDKTINGDYLNSNPHAAGMADLIAQKTQGGYNASFGASGRSHGGLAALLSGQGVGDALGQFYGNMYEGERGRQQQAIGMAPTFNQDEYTGINNLLPAVNNASNMGLNSANQYAQGMGNLIAPYASTKTTQKTGGLGQVLSTGLGLAGMVGGAFMPGAGLLAGAGGGGFSSPLGSGGLSGLMKLPMPQINNGLGGWRPGG